MNLSSLLAFGTTEIALVSVFGALAVAIVLYYCFVPMKNLFTALFAGAYIPSFKLISIKNRKLNVADVVGAYVMAKKARLCIKLNQIEALMLAGGDAKAVVSAMLMAKDSGIELNYQLASAIELASHNVVDVVSSAINTKSIMIQDIRAFAKDKIEIVAKVNISVKLDLDKFTTGLGIDELKTIVGAWIIENISKSARHEDVLAEPNKTLLSNIDLRVICQRSMYCVKDINVGGVETGRNLNHEIELQSVEKEKIYAEIEADRLKNAEEMKELMMRTKTEEKKIEVLEAEKQIPLVITKAIEEGRFSVMDYYKLMNLQADTAMRKAFISDNQRPSFDEGDF